MVETSHFGNLWGHDKDLVHNFKVDLNIQQRAHFDLHTEFLKYLTADSVELFSGGADMLAIEADHVVAQRPAERGLHNVLQLRRHLLRLGEEVDEELGHVLLFPGVEGLVVHGVGLAEGEGVVRLPL